MNNFFIEYGRYFIFSLIALWLIGGLSEYMRGREIDWFNFIRQIVLLVVFWEFMSISLKSLFNYKNQTPLWYKILQNLTPKQRISRGIAAITMAIILVVVAINESFLLLVLLPVSLLLFSTGISLMSARIVNWQLNNIEKMSKTLAYCVIFYLTFYAAVFILSLILSN